MTRILQGRGEVASCNQHAAEVVESAHFADEYLDSNSQ